MSISAGRITATLPGKLDTDAVVTVGVGRAAITKNDGGQRSAGRWPGMDPPAMSIATQGPPGDVCTERGNPVAIKIDSVFFSTFLPRVALPIDFG